MRHILAITLFFAILLTSCVQSDVVLKSSPHIKTFTFKSHKEVPGIENIQFKADSAILQNSEKDKLKKKHYSYKDNETIKKLDGLKKQLENPVYISDIIKKGADDKEIQKVGTGPVQKQNTTSQRHISYKDNDAIKKLDGIRRQLEQPTVYAPGYGKKQTQQVQTGPVQKQETASDKLSAIDKELSGDTKQPATSGPVQKT